MKRDFYTIFEGLNSAQKQAVEQFEGPSLIIAGAGSGKTRVLTCRIANILNHGNKPGSILALTFTNKASKEMKERIAGLVGPDLARNIWMGTFHSVFIRFLRDDAELIGFPKSFTIYDTSDSRSAIRNCVRELQLDDKTYKPNEVLSRISMAKNNLITSAAYLSNAELMQRDSISRKPKIGEIYQLYEKKCRQAGAMDFDDILLYMNIMLRDFPQVLEKLQARFNFLLVDEYQDTNFSQYLIVKKLSARHRNVCVVGDDSQSIYAFRGARIENILNFLKDYPEAKEFKLEQNYRSTRTIVDAANSLIARNSNRLNKECFSESEQGEKIEVVRGYTDQEEAFSIVSSIMSRLYSAKAQYSEFAILYRTNAQSRVVEEALRKRSVPYRIFGGHSFYERAEVKDVMSYMRLLVNPKDDEAFRRVVNVPPRGIGDTTMLNLAAAAGAASVSMWEALHTGDLAAFGIKPAAAARLTDFATLISEIGSRARTTNAYDISMEVVLRSGYMTHLKADTTIEGQARVENVEELFNSIKELEGEYLGGEIFDGEVSDPYADTSSAIGSNLSDDEIVKRIESTPPGFVKSQLSLNLQSAESENSDNPDKADGQKSDDVKMLLLETFLENITLMSAIDEKTDKEDNNKVSLMTVHSAKGLEFPYVYVIGMEDNLFPSITATSSESEIEEERRLFYVALTRAMKHVTLSYAQSRFRWGNNVNYPPSRFLKEIDKKFLNWPALESEFASPFSDGTLSGRSSGTDSPYSGRSSYGSSGSGNSYSGRSSYGNSASGRSSSNGSGSESVNQGSRFGNRSSSGVTNSGGGMNNRSSASQAGGPARGNGSSAPSERPQFSQQIAVSRTKPFIPDSVDKLRVGMNVEHERFGRGKIFSLEGDPLNMRAIVDFAQGGRKTLLLKFAKLRITD
ncbi:MAG: ATP-dependent DNA helicase [Bacteroidetes bacterium HGW-Bacteroidetes-10]|nr:MAG: ATP-dependent DNA helicase [Bacteroidetes bacterium HGW-Bacteroidetes-10]